MRRITSVTTALMAGLLSALLISCAAAKVSTVGKAGSLARFAIKGDILYALSTREIRVFSLKQGDLPQLLGKLRVPTWQAETLFLAKDRLFVGSQDGMYIYDVEQAKRPVLMGSVRHFRSCDPVVVQGNYAYVTLRRGGSCRRGKNVLQVYDVSDSRRPRLMRTYPMTNPWGLGVDGTLLFVADGPAGLKVFDVRNPLELVHLSTHKTIKGYDVIPDKNVLIVSASDGLYQLDYAGRRLRFLSRVPIAGHPERPGIKIDAPLRMVPPPPPPPQKVRRRR